MVKETQLTTPYKTHHKNYPSHTEICKDEQWIHTVKQWVLKLCAVGFCYLWIESCLQISLFLTLCWLAAAADLTGNNHLDKKANNSIPKKLRTLHFYANLHVCMQSTFNNVTKLLRNDPPAVTSAQCGSGSLTVSD